MLAHLELWLVVRKQQPYVAKCMLELRAPYSPVLGVRMGSLDVDLTFSAPAAGRPDLPATSMSRFAGRILFFGTEETLRVTYSDYSRGD
jgi:hypothetical protein